MGGVSIYRRGGSRKEINKEKKETTPAMRSTSNGRDNSLHEPFICPSVCS